MAKITNPLFSLEAHGNMASGLVQFRLDRGRAHAYRPPKPAEQNQKTPSEKQAAQRARFDIIKTIWRDLTPAQKAVWEAKADENGTMKGWSLLLSELLPASNNLDNILVTDSGEVLATADLNPIITD